MDTKRFTLFRLFVAIIALVFAAGCATLIPESPAPIALAISHSGPSEAAVILPTTTTAPVDPAPERVLLVGDSLLYGAADELTTAFAAEGIAVELIGGSGTGLLSEQGRWTQEITEMVSTWDPDIVVIEACCNYALFEPGYQDEDGTAIEPDSPEMYAAWAAEAQRALDAAQGGGAEVYWVTTPPADADTNATYAGRIGAFNAISASLAVPQIDWAATLAPDDAFTPTITTTDGNVVTIRSDDGLHLTNEGDELVAQATVQAVMT